MTPGAEPPPHHGSQRVFVSCAMRPKGRNSHHRVQLCTPTTAMLQAARTPVSTSRRGSGTTPTSVRPVAVPVGAAQQGRRVAGVGAVAVQATPLGAPTGRRGWRPTARAAPFGWAAAPAAGGPAPSPAAVIVMAPAARRAAFLGLRGTASVREAGAQLQPAPAGANGPQTPWSRLAFNADGAGKSGASTSSWTWRQSRPGAGRLTATHSRCAHACLACLAQPVSVGSHNQWLHNCS